jgi:phosphatidylglycerol---prolipoprotein diacylglyceryl transferase
MYPILLQIGPLSIYTYGFFLALAFLSAIWIAGREAQRVGVPSTRIHDLGLLIILAALVGSRLLHVLLDLPRFLDQPLDIFKLWEGGLAYHGGLVLGLAATFWYIRRHHLPALATLDILALGAPLGMAIARIGCLMAGCCYGRPTGLPWAVTFTHPESLGPIGVPLHPTQLYEALLSLGIFALIYVMRTRKRFDGQLMGTYFLLGGLVRFGVEFFRADYRGPELVAGMPVTQLTALFLCLAGGAFLLYQLMALRKQT